MELEVKFKHKHSSDEMKQVFMYVFSDLIVLAKSAPTLRNKQQQKMVLCFYHRNLTLENVSGWLHFNRIFEMSGCLN